MTDLPLSEFEARQGRTDLYRQRPHPMAPEVEFEAKPDRLVWEDSKNNKGEMAYRDVVAVRLSYDPARIQSTRHILDITSKDGKRVRITSNTYRGMAQWRPRNRAFVGFLKDLHGRMAASNERIDFRLGRDMPVFLAYGGVWLVFLAFMAYGAVLAVVAAQWLVAAVLALMVGYFGWQGYVYARNNHPRPYDPNAIPEIVLPVPGENDV